MGTSATRSGPVTFCLVEDRPECEIGIRLLAVTLRRHCAGTRTLLFHPRPSAGLEAWLRGFPDIELVKRPLKGGGSADVKPHALLAAMEMGHGHVAWLDTDMMLAGDPRPMFERLPEGVLGLAREITSAPHQGTELRTRAWGMEPGRTFPHTLNTCLTRVTTGHADLMREWARLLGDERYTRHFGVPLQQRPPHAMFDLDVLNALVGSREWVHVPVHVYETGRDIIHCGGAVSYPVWERIRGLSGPCPPVLHALAAKPWDLLDPSKVYVGRYWAFRKLMQEISPFVALAREYRAEVGMPCPWLDTVSGWGRVLRFLGFGHFALRGFPVAVAGAVARRLGRSAPGL